MMPGGSRDGYEAIKHIVEKVAAQVDDGPCVTYIGPGGSGGKSHPTKAHNLQHLLKWCMHCCGRFDGFGKQLSVAIAEPCQHLC